MEPHHNHGLPVEMKAGGLPSPDLFEVYGGVATFRMPLGEMPIQPGEAAP
jgi:hypothetical protein